MASLQQKILAKLTLFGIDLDLLRHRATVWPAFKQDLAEFKRQEATSPAKFGDCSLYPCLDDKKQTSGTASGHYFHQDLLIAQKIFENRPLRHLDIGSRIDGFVAHVAVFREIEVLDIRPLQCSVPNIKGTRCDLSAEIPLEMRECCDSLSSLHALEHFGLGRYNDPIKYLGHLDGFRNMHQLLKPGGKFYFSTPCGPQRVQFNAHRVFSARYLWNLIEPLYQIETFSYVDDAGELFKHVDLQGSDIQKQIDRSFGCDFGCAIFELRKK